MLERDAQGRYKYDPEYFGNTGKPYTYEEVEYLMNWYEKVGMEEMAFALERTPVSIEMKVRQLRKQGLMKKKDLTINNILKLKMDEVVKLYFQGYSVKESIQKIKANA